MQPNLFSVLPILLIAAISIPLAITDIREHRLPNKYTYTAIICSVLATAFASLNTGRWVDLAIAMIVGSATGLVGYLLARAKAIGMGDIKLLIAMHIPLAWHAPVLVLLSLGLGLGVATIVSLIQLALGKIRPRSLIPLGPYLILGFLFIGAIPVAELFTEVALSWAARQEVGQEVPL